MVINFSVKKLSCGIVKLLSKASNQKAQNRPYTLLIKETSFMERLDTKIGAEDLNCLPSYQMLITDKNWKIY